MSKNITIQEGGSGVSMTVDKLKTAQVGGGNVKFVPEDEVRLTTKTITRDGTYKAAADGYYGYSQVTVSGIGKATGTAADGKEHVIEEDGSGNITDTVLPSSIAITTLPVKLDYVDGEEIDTMGMVVTAYDATGELWSNEDYPNGIIPLEELEIVPSSADKEQAQDSGLYTYGEITCIALDLSKAAVALPGWGSFYYDPFVMGSNPSYNNYPTYMAKAYRPGGIFYVTRYNGFVYSKSLGSSDQEDLVCLYINDQGQGLYAAIVRSIEGNGWYKWYIGAERVVNIPVSTADPTGISSLDDFVPIGGTEPISVVWHRPKDEKELSTSFFINVENDQEGTE